MLFGCEAVWKQEHLGVRETRTKGLRARKFGSKGFWRQGPLKVRVFEAEDAWGQKHLGVKAYAGQKHLGERAFRDKGIWQLERLGVRVF